jgi:hypothetical protein
VAYQGDALTFLKQDNMIKHFRWMGVVAIGGMVAVASVASFAADKPAGEAKYSIEEVMKKIHKPKKENVFSRVVDGKGSAEDKKLIVEYYEAMPLNKPPKGDQKDWEKRTQAILTAAKAVEKGGDAKAIATLKTAANCKECHDIHQE